MALVPDNKTHDEWFTLGSHLHQQRNLSEALAAFQQALFLVRNPTTLSAVATLYSELKQYTEALPLAQEALALVPHNHQLQANIAVLEAHLEQYESALQRYDALLTADPNQLVALINRGAILSKLNQKSAALAHNKNAYQRLPLIAETYFNYADSLVNYFRYQEALSVCEKGLRIAPTNANIMLQKGICLAALQQFDDANQAIDLARRHDPSVLKNFLSQLETSDSAKSIVIDARHIYLESKYRERKVCYWENLAEYEDFMVFNLQQQNWGYSPFSESGYAFQMLSTALPNAERLQLGRLISTKVEATAKHIQISKTQNENKATTKTRLAYISPDFRMHATSVLTRQIYGLHDKTKFEVYGYSLYNAPKLDQYRKDIEASCDVFRDVSERSLIELAQLIKDDEIDILVDLAGFTTHAKFEVFALKPAPVQISYLGYQSTIGAKYIDYAVVDNVVCPEGADLYWQEKLIRLQHSLFPYDSDIDHSPTALKRADYGLPDHVFVFCCLNNNYKIEPVAFTVWMNILKAVPDSVLWLLTDEVDTEANLMREAEARGVSKERLIFAHRVPLEEHVARFQLADLFLDTRWHNAHTTGAEALWQGLPMITCMSEQTSSRGAGSLLYALEMPELVVDSFEAYEELAIYYATHPAEYLAMREKLKAKRYTAPLFDIKLKVKHLERAYQMAWERYQSGLPPEAINVPI